MPEFSTFKMSCFAGEVNFFLRLFYNVHISIICIIARPRTRFPFDQIIWTSTIWIYKAYWIIKSIVVGSRPPHLLHQRIHHIPSIYHRVVEPAR